MICDIINFGNKISKTTEIYTHAGNRDRGKIKSSLGRLLEKE